MTKKEPKLAIPKSDSKKEKRKSRADLKKLKERVKFQVHRLDNWECTNPWHSLWIEQFDALGKLPVVPFRLEATHLIRRSQGGKWDIHDVTSMCNCCGYWTDNGLDHPSHGRITGRQFKIHVLSHQKRNNKNFRHQEQLDRLIREEGVMPALWEAK